jgi:IclR family acetate operon transcriptional repressor
MRQRGPALDGALDLDEFAHASVSAVDRALVLIEALADAPDGLTVSDLSARLRINKGLTHRILSSLVGRDYVVKDERTQHYRLTIRLIGLAFRHLRVLDVYDVILPILRRLAQETGELAELNWVEQGRLVTVAKADSPRQLRVVSYLGEEQVLHASAAGKVWLASLPEEEALRRAVAQGMKPLTPQTITSVTALKTELDLVRAQSYATNVRESGPYVIAVAAPVRARADAGRVVGSVGVVAPAFFAIHEDERIIALTKTAAEEIGQAWPFVSLDG